MPRVRRATVFLNPSSGLKRNGAGVEAVVSAMKAAGIEDTEIIRLGPGVNIPELVSERIRKGTDSIVAAGGDGTVNSVAAALAGTETPLGVLPAGTLNHFAKDVGLPDDLEAAAHVIAEGSRIQVDIGKVNGRVFVNNSSLGLYPAMVRVRERFMKRGIPKHIAMSMGAAAALWQFPNLSVRLTSEGHGFMTRTPFVFVGNNMYQLSGFEAGTRQGLQDGILQVCIVHRPSRLALFRAIALAALGKVEAAPELEMVSVQETRISTLRQRVRVALDGEVVKMRSPLHYTICPKALHVLAPSAEKA